MEKVICILGPTAVGKTDISLKIVEKYNGEIINCDASQMKKDLVIGTAKIDYQNQIVNHHLFDIINACENYSCADYQKEARKLITEINNKGKIPFLVGGTGLYASTTLYKYDLTNEGRKKEDDDFYSNYTNEELFEMLKILDFESTKKVHMNNRVRVIRAIQSAQKGKKISENTQKSEKYYDSLIIVLNTPREILYERINKRVNIMIEEGLIEECKSLKAKGIDLSCIPDIGYKQIKDYLDDKITLEEAIELIQKETRHYAKRQLTWFRNQMDSVFVNVDYDNINKTINEISKLIDNYLLKK